MKITKDDFIQFFRFNIVGVSNTAVDFLAFTLLTQALSVPAYIAQVVSYLAGMLNSYLLNTRWTFRKTHRRTLKQAAGFVVVNVVALGVSLLMLSLCKNVLGIESDMWAKVIATPVTLAVNFLGNRLFVFTPRGDERHD